MISYFKRLVLVSLAVMFPLYAANAVQIIDFDGLASGTDVTDQYAGQGVLVENAQVFTFSQPGSSPPNAICGATNGVLDCRADPVADFFSLPVEAPDRPVREPCR